MKRIPSVIFHEVNRGTIMPHREPAQDLAPFGYAPGYSHFYCIDCNDMSLHPGHQHSIRCKMHAILEMKKACAMLPPAEVEQVVEEPVTTCSQSGIFSRLLVGLSSFFFREEKPLTHP